jgi:hypothetical protein
LLDIALQLLLVYHKLFCSFSPIFYGIISSWAGLLRIELGLKLLSAARHNDELERVLAVGTELPFVVLGLLAVALRLHVYGILVRKVRKIFENPSSEVAASTNQRSLSPAYLK